jgi:peptidoglycan/LPS O-acetylase OafA/YrhL
MPADRHSEIVSFGVPRCDAAGRSVEGGEKTEHRLFPRPDYLPQVDGLRCVAIVLVLAFHFGVPGFRAGFVGVDIFFVISGFVIFRMLFREMALSGSVSWPRFVVRRIRRLVPAACAMVLLTLVTGWFILDAIDYRALCASALAFLSLGSNIFFSATMGYFAGSSELYPLLHTWSLSVEEQFYILVPFLIWFLQKTCRRDSVVSILGKILFTISILSFVANLIVCNNSPTWGFYSLLTRIWQFGVGAMLAFPRFAAALRGLSSRLAGALFILGAALLGISLLVVTSVKYPKFQGLMPTLGSVAVLCAVSGNRDGWASKLLSLKPLVWMGLLSYSLYLWHWPLVSFKKHLVVCDSPMVSGGFFLASVFFALGSHFLIENPFRFRVRSDSTVLAVIGSSYACGIISAGLGITGFLDKPITVQEAAWRQDVDWYGAEFRGQNTPIGLREADADAGSLKLDFVLWGDSQAGMLSGIIDQMGKERKKMGLAFISDASIPIAGHPQLYPTKQVFHDQAFQEILRLRPPLCFIVSSWKTYIRDCGQTVELFSRMAESLGAVGCRLVVLRQFPTAPGSAREFVMSHRFPAFNDFQKPGIHREAYLKDRTSEDSFMSGVIARCNNVTFLDPATVVFDDKTGLMPLHSSDRFHFRDPRHLSWHGANVYGRKLLFELFDTSANRIQKID